MVQITMYAALVAAIRQVHVHADGHSQVERALIDAGHHAHCAPPVGVPSNSGFELLGWWISIGWSETVRMPCPESWVTNSSASRMASLSLTSNCSQILLLTMASSGVRPSADCQMAAATSLSVNRLESTADITIIQLPSLRAAIF